MPQCSRGDFAIKVLASALLDIRNLTKVHTYKSTRVLLACEALRPLSGIARVWRVWNPQGERFTAVRQLLTFGASTLPM